MNFRSQIIESVIVSAAIGFFGAALGAYVSTKTTELSVNQLNKNVVDLTTEMKTFRRDYTDLLVRVTMLERGHHETSL